MSKVLSFRDILLCEELSHIKNEIELLDIKNDAVVASILSKVGFDTDYGVAYIPSKHRDMNGKVAVGFQAVGEIQCNRAYITSKLCTAEERIIAAGKTDMSLAHELQTINSQSRDWGATFEDDAVTDARTNNGRPSEEVDDTEKDFEFVAAQIKQLEELRDVIRGSMFNEAGDIKTFREYSVAISNG